MRRLLAAPVLVFALSPAWAQEDDRPLDIDVGSSRIGGPGLTPAERSANAAEEDEVALTEETLPPKGNPKRLPGLHKIAARYARGQMWKDACDRYDQILEESGVEGLRSSKDAPTYASKVYFHCAEIEFRAHKLEKAEALLKKSEGAGPSDHRHAGLRRQMMRDAYHEEIGKGNVAKALEIFRRYNADKPDEDERIWLGEQLAARAWETYRAKDEVSLDRAIADAEAIAPMNTELRQLKDKIYTERTILSRVLVFTLIGGLSALVLTALYRWRARARMAALEAAGDHEF